MARPNRVTRTIKATNATVLCLDTVSAEPFNTTVKLAGTFKDNKTLLKACKPLIETSDNISAVKVVDVSVESKLYGMLEQDFLKYAEEMPPRSVKE